MKKFIGILSVLLSGLVIFEGITSGSGNVLSNSRGVITTGGIILVISMLVAGILTLTSQNSRRILIIAIALFISSGITGLANISMYVDLQIWSILNLIFGGGLMLKMGKGNNIVSEYKN